MLVYNKIKREFKGDMIMTKDEIALVMELWNSGKSVGEIARLLPYKEYIAKREISELKKKGVLKGRSGKSRENTQARVLQAFNDGITSPYEIAEMCGVGVGHIRNVLSQAKVKIQRPKRNYKQRKLCENTQAIITALKSGKTVREICAEFGVSTQYVYLIKGKFVNKEEKDIINTREEVVMPQINNIPLKLSEIETNLKNGSYVIPDFQRDFVWTLEQSAKLIDSWVKGFPIGIFIMWVTETILCPTKKIGNIIAFERHDETGKITYILDGQQRITSIYATIVGLKIDKKRDYNNIVINLDAINDDGTPIDYSIDVVTVLHNDSNFTYMSVKELIKMNLVSIMQKYDEQTINKIQNFRDLIIEKSFSAIKIENANIEIATDIFTRLNTGAKKLSPFEIMTAKTYVEGEFNLVPRTRELIESLDVDYRSNFKESDILKILSLCIRKNTIPKTQLDLTKEEVTSSFIDVSKAIKRAISFCKSHLNIKTGKYLPYSAIIWLYTYFFYKFNKQNKGITNPSPWQISYLTDYYWRAILTERYDRASDPRIAHDAVHVIDNILNNNTPKQEPVYLNVEKFIEDGQFDKKSAYIMGLINLLISKDPKSLKTNSSIEFNNIWASQSDKNNFHHFFPKKMENHTWEKSDPVDNICNIILSDAATNQIDIGNQRPSKYIPKLMAENKDIAKTLKNHLIKDIEDYGILKDDFELFIFKRAGAFIDELKSRLKTIEEDKISDAI